MNWDNLDWDNFSCVDMQRQIRNKINAEIVNMSSAEIIEYLREEKPKDMASNERR